MTEEQKKGYLTIPIISIAKKRYQGLTKQGNPLGIEIIEYDNGAFNGIVLYTDNEKGSWISGDEKSLELKVKADFWQIEEDAVLIECEKWIEKNVSESFTLKLVK